MRSKAAFFALALLVCGAAAQAPAAEQGAAAAGPFSITAIPPGEFANKGGPPAGEGIYRGTFADAPLAAVNTPVGYSFSWYQPTGQLIIEIANYTSWQCYPDLGPGGYIARYVGKDYTLDFTETAVDVCEIGVIDRQAGTWNLVDKSAPDCPTSWTDGDVYNTILIPPQPGDKKGYASANTAFCGA